MDLIASGFEGYRLIASGDGRKLESFGGILLNRPSPQAIWPMEHQDLWKRADAHFERSERGSGKWTTHRLKKEAAWPAKWNELEFELRLTGFGNVGLFPEHTVHWTWMADLLATVQDPQVLNLFAYTGGASLACALAGAQVTHVDAAKSVNAWAMLNAERSQIPKDRIRFLTDDAIKLAKREGRRKRIYQGIILDPPTFGRGSKGEVWKIEQHLYTLVQEIKPLLSGNSLFVLLTSHSPGITPNTLATMLSPLDGRVTHGEMLIAGDGPQLPAGVYARWTPR